jgi:hypothetical protein
MQVVGSSKAIRDHAAAKSWRHAAVNVSFPDCFGSTTHNLTNPPKSSR